MFASLFCLLAQALLHPDKEFRLGAFGLLCYCPHSSVPLSSVELQLIRLYFLGSVKSTLPAVAQRTCANLEHAMQKLEDSTRLARRRLQWLSKLNAVGPQEAGA